MKAVVSVGVYKIGAHSSCTGTSCPAPHLVNLLSRVPNLVDPKAVVEVDLGRPGCAAVVKLLYDSVSGVDV